MPKNFGTDLTRWTFQRQAHATLSQAAAVQNTWYTVLDTINNVRVDSLKIIIDTANEDLEMKITIDGIAITIPQANAVAGTSYFLSQNGNIANGFSLGLAQTESTRSFLVEARTFKVEVRKTTANGGGLLGSRVIYDRRV